MTRANAKVVALQAVKRQSGDVKVFGACRCTICNHPADLLGCGLYQCQNSSAHTGDTMTGIFTDHSRMYEL